MVIGPDEKIKLESLKKNAEENPFSFDDLLDMKNGDVPLTGDRPEFVTNIPDGFRIVYSIEQNVGPEGFINLRHLSISAPDDGRVPNPAATGLLMFELGFTNTNLEDGVKSDHLMFWLEDIGPNHQAINIVERVDGGTF